MSIKKQISSLCKHYSVYKEIPEEFQDETDVDKYFHHNILDISQPTTELFGLAKDPIKSLLHSKYFIFAIQITAAFYSQVRSLHFQKRN